MPPAAAGDAEHDDEGVEEAFEEGRHQQVGDDEGEDEIPLERLACPFEAVGGSREVDRVGRHDFAALDEWIHDLSLDVVECGFERCGFGRGNLDRDGSRSIDVVDLFGPGGDLDAGDRTDGHHLPTRRVNEHLPDVLRSEPVVDAPQGEIDLFALVLISVDEYPVHDRVDRDTDVARRETDFGCPYTVGDDADFGVAEIETGNGSGLRAGDDLVYLSENTTSEADETVEVGPGDLDVDGASTASLEETGLPYDGDHTGDRE